MDKETKVLLDVENMTDTESTSLYNTDENDSRLEDFTARGEGEGSQQFQEEYDSQEGQSFQSGPGEGEGLSDIFKDCDFIDTPTMMSEWSKMEYIGSKIQDHEEAKKVAKEVFNRYSVPTHVGNWYEQLCAFEANQSAYSEMIDSGSSSGQRVSVALDYLNQPIILDPETKPEIVSSFIQISSVYQFARATRNPKTHLTLAACMSQAQCVDGIIRKIIPQASVGLSRNLDRVRRNIFGFLRADTTRVVSKTLRYNTPYYLRLMTTENKVYLRCVSGNMATVGLFQGNFPITITDVPDRYCLFHVAPVNAVDAIPDDGPGYRVRFNELISPTGPVETHTPVLICHTMSNYHLTVATRGMVVLKNVGEPEIWATCARRLGNGAPPEDQWQLKTSSTAKCREVCTSAGEDNPPLLRYICKKDEDK